LPVFGYLEKLRYLDLSNNSIELVETNTFTLLFNLYSLDLNNNFLSKIEKNAFASLSNLYYLKLKNNYLTKLPDISKLTSLVLLDVSNQNGNLVLLKDFQFERTKMPNLALEVNLDNNDILNVNNKAFCSRNYLDSHLDTLSLSFKTFSNLIDSNHCILGQLKPNLYLNNTKNKQIWTQLNIIGNNVDNNNNNNKERNYCNCDLILMFMNYKLNVTGFLRNDNCDLIKSNESCLVNHTYIDTCFNQDDYICNTFLPGSLVNSTNPTKFRLTNMITVSSTSNINNRNIYHIYFSILLAYIFIF